jgi:uncharacterized protein YjbJ (UPF0337 family)
MVDSDRIEGTINKVKGQVERAAGGFAGDAKTQAEGTFDEVSGRAQATLGKARDVARDGTDALRAYAEDRPLQAMLIAGAVGLVIGVFASRR